MLRKNKKIRVAMPHDIDELECVASIMSYLRATSGIDNQYTATMEKDWNFHFSFLDKIKLTKFLIENEYNLKYLFDTYNDQGMYIDVFSEVKYGINNIKVNHQSLGIIENSSDFISYLIDNRMRNLEMKECIDRSIALSMLDNNVSYLPHIALDFILETLEKNPIPLYAMDKIQVEAGRIIWHTENSCEYGYNIKQKSRYCN